MRSLSRSPLSFFTHFHSLRFSSSLLVSRFSFPLFTHLSLSYDLADWYISYIILTGFAALSAWVDWNPIVKKFPYLLMVFLANTATPRYQRTSFEQKKKKSEAASDEFFPETHAREGISVKNL
jgi:hypothetical protein